MVLKRERERGRNWTFSLNSPWTLYHKWTFALTWFPESHVWFVAAPEGLSNLSWIARLSGSRGGSLWHQSQTKKRPRWLWKLGHMEHFFWSYIIALWFWCCWLFFDFKKTSIVVLNMFWSMATYIVAGCCWPPSPCHPMVFVGCGSRRSLSRRQMLESEKLSLVLSCEKQLLAFTLVRDDSSILWLHWGLFVHMQLICKYVCMYMHSE